VHVPFPCTSHSRARPIPVHVVRVVRVVRVDVGGW